MSATSVTRVATVDSHEFATPLNLNKLYSYKEETNYDDETGRSQLPTSICSAFDLDLLSDFNCDSFANTPSRKVSVLNL